MSGEVFEIVIPVRWSDQDMNGHVNNVRVGTLLEEARILWRKRGAETDGIDNLSPGPLVASTTINYRRPILYGPELLLRLWVARIGNSSYTMAYEGVQSGETVLDATVVMVAIDTESRPRPLNDRERAQLHRFLAE